jgi:hypothetical protein
MQKPPRISTSRSTRTSVVWATVLASSAALLSAAGCQIEATPAPADAGTTGAGAGGVMGMSGASSATGGSVGTTGGTGGTTSAGTGGTTGGTGGVGVGGTPAAGTGGVGTGGAVAGSGGTGTGGVAAGSAGMSAGGTGSGGKACVDIEPPPDPEWPDANCQKWATETTECSAPWFATYCDASCGRCVPEGGSSGGAGGGGGMGAGGMGAAGRPCVDTEPPPNEEWPDATCERWATETTECSAPWFATYCDVSCGRCVPPGGGGTGGQAGTVDCSTRGLPNVTGGNGYATRYWDCCQTHCSQFDGKRCGQDGVSSTGNNQSACSGGQSFACYDEAPRKVDDCLSYGHIAKSNPNCGGCYRIQFTGEGQYSATDPGSRAIKGKQMIVKVTNTGGDVGGSQFDLMIPGGGVGQFNACSRQWGTSDLGAQYGGFLTNCSGSHSAKKDCVRQNCMKIPAGKAREGCLWFVDWFEVADNPKFTSQATSCPF